jgi:MFS transporter, DHA1 family, multidrug resistance protein
MSVSFRQLLLIPFLGALAALGPLASDLFVPSLSLVASGLGVSSGSVQLTMSAVLVGFSLGAAIYGPLSDKFGRKPVLLAGLAIYIVASIGAAFALSLSWLVALRVVQGLGASSGMVLARALILDRWTGHDASRAMSWVQMFAFFTPVVAPVAGGHLATLGYWPLVFWVHAGAGLLCFVVTLTLLPRVRRMRQISVLQALAGYGPVLKDRKALGFMACTGLCFAGVIAFVSNSSFVLVDFFGLAPHQFGYCFAVVMLGASASAYVNGRLVERVGISRLLSLGTSLLAIGGVGFLLGAALGGGVIAVMIACFVYISGLGFVLSNAMARTLSRFPGRFGAASAVFSVNQFIVGALVAALLSTVQTPSALPLATTMAIAGAGAAGIWWIWLRD